MKPNIALIGMMGAGKTTIGTLLSRTLNAGLFDIDAEIEQATGMTIPEIFARHGETHFRTVEHDMCRKIPHLRDMIIATGGGIVLDARNVALLRQSCVIFYLKASADKLNDHLVGAASGRPLLHNHSIEELLNTRQHLYEAAADHTIITDDKGKGDICAEILDYVEHLADFGGLRHKR